MAAAAGARHRRVRRAPVLPGHRRRRTARLKARHGAPVLERRQEPAITAAHVRPVVHPVITGVLVLPVANQTAIPTVPRLAVAAVVHAGAAPTGATAAAFRTVRPAVRRRAAPPVRVIGTGVKLPIRAFPLVRYARAAVAPPSAPPARPAARARVAAAGVSPDPAQSPASPPNFSAPAPTRANATAKIVRQPEAAAAAWCGVPGPTPASRRAPRVKQDVRAATISAGRKTASASLRILRVDQAAAVPARPVPHTATAAALVRRSRAHRHSPYKVALATRAGAPPRPAASRQALSAHHCNLDQAASTPSTSVITFA